MHSKILPDYCISGRAINSVDGLVIHYFSGKNVDPDNAFDLSVCRNLFLDLNRPKTQRQRYMREEKWPTDRMYASAHVLVGREGEIWKLVEFDRQAYHAGASIMGKRKNCNRWTLGLELVGGQSTGFSEAQYEALSWLVLELMDEHKIPRSNVVGHDTVRWAAIQAGTATGKRPKYDPSGRKDGLGDNFDWDFFWSLADVEAA